MGAEPCNHLLQVEGLSRGVWSGFTRAACISTGGAMSAASAAIAAIEARVACCFHCGKGGGAALKKCATCQQASYCGAECQKAHWKLHKKTCGSRYEVWEKVKAAHAGGDWRGVLKYEWRMEDLMEGLMDQLPDGAGENEQLALQDGLLILFLTAKKRRSSSTGTTAEDVSSVKLWERRVEILGTMERYRDQGDAICNLANMILRLPSLSDSDARDLAGRHFERVRKIGAAHGFFSLEAGACQGLGRVAMLEGRDEEAADLLRNAVASSKLSEAEDPSRIESMCAVFLIDALFKVNALDELEATIQKFREDSMAESRREGRFSYMELYASVATARLHEVVPSLHFVFPPF